MVDMMVKEIQEFIEKNCNIIPSDIPEDDGNVYVSKFDGSYITRVGMEEHIEKLYLRFGITEQIQSSHKSGKVACIGFNPDEQMWYGWSHRAAYGFGIGSTCSTGDCHYRPKDIDDFIDECNRFWNDEYNVDVMSEIKINDDGVKGVYTSWKYNNTPNEEIRGKINGVFSPLPDEWGKGEWTATTLEEAKQMAIDFAEGVS
jgi:hypothetical protein